MNKSTLRLMVVFLVSISLAGLNMVFVNQALAQQKKITLNVVESGSLSAGEKKVIELFKKTHPNIELKVQEIPWGQVFNQMVVRIQAGNPPDVWTGAPARFIPVFADMKALVPLNNQISLALRNEYFDSIWSMVTYKGKIYGVPSAFSTKALYWNKTLFVQAGVQGPPTTWNELYESAKSITKGTDAFGIGLDGMGVISTTTQFLNYLYQDGGRIIGREGNITINNERGIDALKFYNSLKNFAPNPIENAREKTLAALFAEGKIAMYIGGPWRRKGFVAKGVNFGVATLPRGHYGPSATTLVADAVYVMKGGKEDPAIEYALFYTNFQNQLIRDTGIGLGKEVDPMDPTAATPMRKIEAKLPFFWREATWKPFIEMIPRGVPQPFLSSYPSFQDAMNKAIQKVLLGKATAKEALDEVAKKIKGLVIKE